jgi:hypothetical protein
MTTRAPWFGALALLTFSASARAQTKDAAELLPASTLACIEVRQPERLFREAAALLKGSTLDDLPRRLAKMRTAGAPVNNWQVRNHLTGLGVFLGSETINEAGRIRGGFVALTGFAKDGTPEVVAVLQTGSSNFPGLMMRIVLTESWTHIVGEVEGVPLYRQRMQIFAPGGPQPQERESGPVMAQLPGTLPFGSSVDSLKEVIRRSKGKSADTSLASVQAFKKSAALRDRPGVFAYLDATALAAQLDEQTRQSGHLLGRTWAVLKTALGDETVRNLTASLTLRNGELELQVTVNLTGKGNSPLLQLLPDKAAGRELLHFAPTDALLAVAGGFGEGEKRWKTFLTLLDALDKLDGRGEANRPSKIIGEMEEKLKLRIGKDVLARINAAALAVDSSIRKDHPAHPLLIFRAADAESARTCEEKELPKLFGLADGEVTLPAEEEIQGQRIRTVGPTKLFGRQSVHYERQGAVLVLGLDGKRVAGCLTAGGKKTGLLAETKVAGAFQDADAGAVMAGVIVPEQAVMDFFVLLGSVAAPRAMPVPGKIPAPPPQKKPAETSPVMRQLRKAVEPMPPLVFTLGRQPESLVLQMRQGGLRRAAPRLLDAWIESILQGTGQGPGVPAGGSVIIEKKKTE